MAAMIALMVVVIVVIIELEFSVEKKGYYLLAMNPVQSGNTQ